MRQVSKVAVAAGFALCASFTGADAATVTVQSITGVWSSAALEGNGAPSGVGTSQIRWGEPAEKRGKQSSYSFSAARVGVINPEETFVFGTFTHQNYPIYDPVLASAVLSVAVSFAIDGVEHSLNAAYGFTHDETPNVAGTCPAGSASVCDDLVSFAPISGAFDTVEVGGVSYTFLLDGFLGGGTPVDFFMTKENKSNSAKLVGRFTAEVPEVPGGPEVSPVPLPAPALLLIAGLGGLGAMRARRR